MKILFITISFLLCATTTVVAQNNRNQFNQIDEQGNVSQRMVSPDSLGSDKEVPKGLYVWTVDKRFGDPVHAEPDTVSHMFMNSIFTTGLRGEYNTTGNVGAPRINRIFIDRPEDQEFIFIEPYDYFVIPVENYHFTNTLSHITNLSYNTCGDRTDGEDHLKALFAVNVNKRLGVGMKFDYIYGRGYYQNQSTALFDYTLYGSYLGDKYQAHAIFSTNHQKVSENGGITDDNYITHPEVFDDDYQPNEIPTFLSNNWNRNDNLHFFLSHRYNIGFYRKVAMTADEIKAKKFALESQKEKENEKEKGKDGNKKTTTYAGRPDQAKIVKGEAEPEEEQASERIRVNGKQQADSLLALKNKETTDSAWMKTEYVPVTGFIHTMNFDTYKRIYQAYKTPSDYYLNDYGPICGATGDSIFDKTKYFDFSNTFAISLLEGFNKWAKAGLKAFVTYDLRHFELPNIEGGMTTYNEHNLSLGGQLSKKQGSLLHYDATAEYFAAGYNAGELTIDANADLNFRFLGDTVQLAAKGFYHHITPGFYYGRYHARHFWWDIEDLKMMDHTRIEGLLSFAKTRTILRVAMDDYSNYAYFAQSYTLDDKGNRNGMTLTSNQSSKAVTVLTASLRQDFHLGILNWENEVTYQKSSDLDVLPLPDINLYSNLYLKFKIAKVLSCDFGADVRYFTKYYAPDYNPALGQYVVQGNEENRVEIGNYPFVNVYANFLLKKTRFFVMYSHANESMGNSNYFLVPHYPQNGSSIRFGLSWTFFN